MRRPLVPLTAAAALAAAGCGAAASEPLPVACQAGEASIVRALGAAPGEVTLDDGTSLSTCVSAAQDNAELQAVGLVLSGAAERLAREQDAVALGYLVGAARRGSQRTAGVALELVRRLEASARQVRDRAALASGLRAGEATG